MKKRIFSSVILVLMLLPALCIPAFAADIFNYDKYINNPNYEVRAETRNNAKMYNWNGTDPDKVTDTGERLLLYYLFNARDAKEKAGYRLFEQTVHLKYKLPSVYTSLYTPGRKYRYYVADFSAGRNDVKDNMLDDNIEEYQYQYYYEDFNRENKGLQPGETEAYCYGYVVAHAPSINLYHLKYDNTPAMEDAAQKQYEEWNKEKEANTDERNTITVERQGGGDSILVAYHSFWDDSGEDTHKTYKYSEGTSTLIEEAKYESTQETYEYYYYTRIPGISDAYTVNHVLLNRLTGYKIGLVSPKKEAVDLYNDMMEKWKATVAMAPTLYSMMPEVIADDPITYEGFNIAGVTQSAASTPGEDGGVSVPAAIVISVLGGGAAIAGAAAASGGSDDKKKKQKAYKMYVQKDFGDAIRKGANPVKIRARMVEVDEFGKEHDRDDLTEKIGVTGDGMTVHSVILSGRYCEATVSVPENTEEEKAGILFVFEGEGGTFTNKVIFRLIDEAYIHFVEENEDGSLKPLGNRISFDAILGDKRDYSALFLLRDATEEPVRFNTESEGGNFRIRVESTDRQYLYRAVFDNRSAAPEENEIFSKIIKQVQYITAVFSDGTEAGCYATASLFPEGLSVRAEKVENERIPIRCYGMEEYENVSDRFTGEKFYLTLAVKTEQGAAVFHLLDKKVNSVFGKKMEGDTRLNSPEADKVAEKFTFKIDPAGGGEFFFIPKDWLFQPEAETIYGAVLSVACTYDGVRYERYIPFRLIGQLPDPMGDWNKEYNDLRRRVEKFSLPGQKDTWVKRFEECSTKPPCSVEELRLVSKEILHRYMEYWEKHNEEDKAECLKYDNLLTIAEWTKFIGDCAFSTLMRIYAGPLADCIITPCKDIFLYSLGEWLASYSRGESFDVENLEIYKSLNTAGDLVSYMYVSKGIKANPKKMFYYIAGYFVIAIFRNYLKKLGEKGESDWWGAITAAFKDLTISSLRFAAGELFQKWLNSKSFQKLFGEQLQKQIIGEIKLTNDVNISGKGITITENVAVVTQMTKAAERFLVKFAGKGAGIVYDTLPARFAASQFGRNEQGHPVYCFPLNDPNSDATIYIEINLVQMITCASTGFLAPLTYLFQVFFNGLIGANAPISIERDPPAERQRSRELKSEAELKAGYQAMFSDAGDHP